jgi:aspartyl-tRNA(Asn)/glutamyl-tRNA(Gln) amidotransferase subunit A
VINLLEAQGEVNLASLHMCEFALSPTGFNLHYGHGKNPWNPEMSCGGSSSGSGIAVAARLVYGSLGSDTGGSIRHPSAMCGVTGLKTTAAFISEEGVFPLAPSLDVVGPMAQTARDCARILTVISEHAKNYEEHLNGDLRGVRIGIPRTYYRENVDQEMAIALDLSLDVLRHRGAQLVEVEVPDMSLINSMMVRVMAFESLGIHREWLKTRPEDYAEQVRLRIELGHTFTTEQYQQAMSARKGILENFVRTSFANCDVLHVPTIQVQTPSIADSSSGTGLEILQKLAQVTQVTKSLNYLGLPGMSVPAGFSKVGMPLAFQLIGRSLDEALLLKTADAYQSETSWHKKIPQLQ